METVLSKEIVRIYTDGREGEEIGHFIRCSDCGQIQLISKSSKQCGKCASKNIIWVEENKKVVSPEDIEDMGYDLEFMI